MQLGAFSDERWARLLKDRVSDLFAAQNKEVSLRILQSERDTEILHKVWLGPLRDPDHRSEIAALVEAAELGKPINVEVD